MSAADALTPAGGSMTVLTKLLGAAAGLAAVLWATAGSSTDQITHGTTFDTVTIPVVIAFITAAVTFFGMRRRYSGKIGSSDAQDLWRESQAMRHEWRDEVVRLRAVVDAHEEELEQCKTRCRELTAEMAALRRGMTT